MTDWIYSCVMICPAELQSLTNQLAEGLGHGPGNLSVPLSGDGAEPATHYGCRAQAQQSFVDLVTAAGGGQLPEIEGMTPEQVGAVLTNLSIDFQVGVNEVQHFTTVAGALGLQRVEAPE